MEIPTATLVDTKEDVDSGTNETYEIYVFRESKEGRYFAVDASYLIDEDPHLIPTPFGFEAEILD